MQGHSNSGKDWAKEGVLTWPIILSEVILIHLSGHLDGWRRTLAEFLPMATAGYCLDSNFHHQDARGGGGGAAFACS